jgi:NAD(P)-dependent dehydrogenase (short-subunit alcohol dehydrogenase family)
LSISKEEIIRAASSPDVVTFSGDISEEEVCIGLIDTAIKEFGRVDVLVNNAGINGPEKRLQKYQLKNGMKF